MEYYCSCGKKLTKIKHFKLILCEKCFKEHKEIYNEAKEYLIGLGWKSHIGKVEEKVYTYSELIEVVIEVIKKAKEEER